MRTLRLSTVGNQASTDFQLRPEFANHFLNVRALSFDCFGTLVDWETGIGSFIANWIAVAVPQCDISIVDAFAHAIARSQARWQSVRPFIGYREVLKKSWKDACSELGLKSDEEAGQAFSNSLNTWPFFQDTSTSLRLLSNRFALGIVSNVDEIGLHDTIARMAVPIGVAISAEHVRSYKPSYEHFNELLKQFEERGIATDEVLHLAQSQHHDIIPATALGIKTIWVNRRACQSGNGMSIIVKNNVGVPTIRSIDQLLEFAQK